MLGVREGDEMHFVIYVHSSTVFHEESDRVDAAVTRNGERKDITTILSHEGITRPERLCAR